MSARTSKTRTSTESSLRSELAAERARADRLQRELTQALGLLERTKRTLKATRAAGSEKPAGRTTAPTKAQPTQASPIEITLTDLGEDFARISSTRMRLEQERDQLKAQLARAADEARRMREKLKSLRSRLLSAQLEHSKPASGR